MYLIKNKEKREKKNSANRKLVSKFELSNTLGINLEFVRRGLTWHSFCHLSPLATAMLQRSTISEVNFL